MASFKVLMLLMSTAFVTIEAQESLDLTLVPNSSGIDVVRTVVSKIVFSNVFTSENAGEKLIIASFMRTMAYIETRDGNQLNPLGGGIWNIERQLFSDTKARMNSEYRDIVHRLNQTDPFNYIGRVDWETIIYDNLSIPLYSGLTARIIMNLTGNLLPTVTNPDYHSYWCGAFKTRQYCYNMFTVEEWNEQVMTLQHIEDDACAVDTDLVFVLDESGSIKNDSFQRVKSFVYNFSSAFLQDETTETRVGVITFNNTATEHIALNSSLGNEEILSDISDLPYNKGGTNTAAALELMRQQAWRDEIHVLRLAIVITDGMSNNIGDTIRAAKKVHEHVPPIAVYTIGVGLSINRAELQTIIASRPETYTHLDSFATSSLNSASNIFSYQICFAESQNLNITNEEHGTLGRGVTTRLRYFVPHGEGITFRICLESGRIIIYASDLPNPGPAQYGSRREVTANFLPLNCETIFFQAGEVNGSPNIRDNNRRRRRQVSSESDLIPLYITLEGQDEENVFSFSSHDGNISIDVNECEEEPCDPNAKCINTDGSFYCVCSERYTGNGTACFTDYIARPGKENTIIAIILPTLLILIAVIGIMVIITTILIVRYHSTVQKHKKDNNTDTEPDGLLEVDEDMFAHHGPERFVPTMVKKYENMTNDDQ